MNQINKRFHIRSSEFIPSKKSLSIVNSEQNLTKIINKQSSNQLLSYSRKHNTQQNIELLREFSNIFKEQYKRKYSPNSKKQPVCNPIFFQPIIIQKSKQKISKQNFEKNKLRSTYTQNINFMKNDRSISKQKIQNTSTDNYFTFRKSFNPSQRLIKQKFERIQYTNLQTTLHYLQSKVNNAKNQLYKKKQRRIKQGEKKSILQNYNEQNHLASEQSQISHTQTITTVKKIPKLCISSLVSSVPKPNDIKGFEFNPYSPREHNIYYVSEIIRAIHEKNSIATQHINSSIKILKALQSESISSYSQIQQKKLNLKKKDYYKDRKTLVFDLDQTLIHCIQNNDNDCDVKLPIVFTTGQQVIAGINIRPHALTLLNQLSKKFQLIIFTASHSCYANAVLDFLDPENKIFQHRLYRQHCHYTQSGMYIKDLRIINRNLSELVLIDNAAYSYAYQLQNGIPILPYYEGGIDYELKALKSYLDKLSNVKDVRQLNKRTFKLHHYAKYNNSEQLIQQLYINS